MNPELATAFAPILRDLAGVPLEVRDESWTADPTMAQAMVYSPDGSGAGVWVHLGQPHVAQVVFLADKVQEWAVEALWSLGRSATWPQCPHHPDTHPLAPVARTGRAVWVCPVRDDEVGEVGGITAAAS